MTLALDVMTHIRRLYYAEHWRVGTISAELKVHPDAVKHALGLWGVGMSGKRVFPTLLDEYKPFIRETLEKHPRLRATRILEMVKSRGYEGSYEAVKRYAREVRPQGQAEAFFRLETLPGEEAQVDWGLFGKIKVHNGERRLCCFVMVMSHSRAVFARFFLDMSMENFLAGHVQAFGAFGGVPRAILYDNLKSGVLQRLGDAIRFHPRILELAGQYHFSPNPCAPYRGNEKGKVERTIRYIRDSFFAARQFHDVDGLNAQLSKWVSEVAMARPWPAGKDEGSIFRVFEAEKPRLLPLPAAAFDTAVIRPVSAKKTPYVRFDGNDYSIPHALLRKPLTLRASETEVTVFSGLEEVARHTRSYDKAQRVENLAHLQELAEAKRHAHNLRIRDMLRAQLSHAQRFIEALALHEKSLPHETQRLLKLLEKYGAQEVDTAMAEALGKDAISAVSVAHILDSRARARGEKPPLDVVVPDSVKHIRVTAHSLSDYDTLLKLSKKGES